NSRSARTTASGGMMDQSITARLAHAEISMSQPARGRYQMAIEAITYSHSACSCSHRSGCQSALPSDEWDRNEMMNAISKADRSAAVKYTIGIATRPVNSFARTMAVSEMGRDFQKRTLRSFRSAFRQSSRCQLE